MSVVLYTSCVFTCALVVIASFYFLRSSSTASVGVYCTCMTIFTPNLFDSTGTLLAAVESWMAAGPASVSVYS